MAPPPDGHLTVFKLAGAALALALGLVAVVLFSALTEWPSTTSRAEVVTSAPVDAIWETLVGFEDYDAWNPFVTRASGVARQGAAVELRLEPPGAKAVDTTATIVILRPGRKLRLQSRLVAPGIRDLELEFLIDVASPGKLAVTGIVRREGVLVPLSDDEGMDAGLGLMLATLTSRAESVAQA